MIFHNMQPTTDFWLGQQFPAFIHEYTGAVYISFSENNPQNMSEMHSL